MAILVRPITMPFLEVHVDNAQAMESFPLSSKRLMNRQKAKDTRVLSYPLCYNAVEEEV